MRYPMVAVAALLVACTAAPASLTPVGMVTVAPERVQGWVRATEPRQSLEIQYGAVFTSKQYDGGRGSGVIRILPTDSLRFDFKGPLGSHRSAAAVVGDSALWAEPKEDVEKMVPNYPLLWAMVGVARPPQPGEALRGLESGGTTAWQYLSGGDTVTYVRTAREFRAEVTRDGKRLGRVVTTFGADGTLAKARLDVDSPQTRLEITFRKVSPGKQFGKEIWNAPGN